MTLRTPRRRISPRTKLKYQAIKNFFRKALGTSQGYINNTNSSIEVSVSELKSKIDILEQQLNRVSKHCQDLATLEQTISNESDKLTRNLSREQEKLRLGTIQKPKKSDRHLKKVETQLLYQNSSREFHKRHKSANNGNNKKHEDRSGMTSFGQTYNKNISDIQLKPQNIKYSKFYELKNNLNGRVKNVKPKYNTIEPMYSTSSFRSLAIPTIREYNSPDLCGHQYRIHKKNFIADDRLREGITRRDINDHERKYKTHDPSRKNKHEYTEVDEEFIADIIKRQYKPVKLFGKRHSDFSQFSAPVCRDQEYKIRRVIQEGSELCSCCYDEGRRQKHRYIRNSDLSDMRSICDTRLYNLKRRRSHHRRYIDDFNNETLYDVVPVKEKSSPKSRKNIAEQNVINYHCNEVPPSPRTHRPRLNLKVHNYTAFEDSQENGIHQNFVNSPIREQYGNEFNKYETDFSVDSAINKRIPHRSAQNQKEAEIIDSLQRPNFINDQITKNLVKDTTLNTHVTDSTADKTDKTLGEIKDILQSFLLEMKKESTHNQKCSITSNVENNNKQEQENKKTNMNAFNCNMGQCSATPFLPTFPNPCCYPVIPMNLCPMNCLHNSYIVPNPSFTCTACAKNSKVNTCVERECCNNKIKTSQENNTNNETEELIKEIYKFVSQNPKSVRKTNKVFNVNNGDSPRNERRKNEKVLTNRSAGGSSKAFKHDANVGTPNMKCYSKSCEAFGSRMPSDTYHTTNASYSDTVLEKFSLEATQSSTESDVSTDTPVMKKKRSKFKKILQSLKLFKKKKEVIEELNESRNSANEKHTPPFQQHITNYAMHGQEFFHAPPIPKQHFCPAYPYTHSYNQRDGYKQLHPHDECCVQHRHYCYPISPHCDPTHYSPGQFYSNCDPRYNHQQTPQVPLCLKEIEVKSIGTQSVRKMSIFRKFTKKTQPGPQQDVSLKYSSPAPANKPSLWKSLQNKAKQQNTDPLTFSLKTQNQLAKGDMKLRNAMLKKLLYKRNPFSPRNLIVRTLLGKDKSSFGNPPKMYKPRIFL